MSTPNQSLTVTVLTVTMVLVEVSVRISSVTVSVTVGPVTVTVDHCRIYNQLSVPLSECMGEKLTPQDDES